ncbi:MAG: hypothetical protein CMK65_18250 [Pseudoalteromonas sp.]|nr:hypothetical protein [Pseudoalteromonas sp.]
MFGMDAALSPIYVEQPHDIGSALLKYQTYCCKINHNRSTRPSLLKRNFPLKFSKYLIAYSFYFF